jgi:hypothetical protein
MAGSACLKPGVRRLPSGYDPATAVWRWRRGGCGSADGPSAARPRWTDQQVPMSRSRRPDSNLVTRLELQVHVGICTRSAHALRREARARSVLLHGAMSWSPWCCQSCCVAVTTALPFVHRVPDRLRFEGMPGPVRFDPLRLAANERARPARCVGDCGVPAGRISNPSVPLHCHRVQTASPSVGTYGHPVAVSDLRSSPAVVHGVDSVPVRTTGIRVGRSDASEFIGSTSTCTKWQVVSIAATDAATTPPSDRPS